ncbi:DnaD domain-containing protein [Brevibacillus daliensis]|uniref:DnaD domain-containing protein n=1 Tax=Brevibacillus daliensis TaxID=2892995 RepID=UPI001E55EFA4|nr:DnaD domain protein [Brevibacillus daliensis]
MDRQIRQILKEGSTSVSNLLLKNYKRMSLTDEEMMFIIHLLSFQQEGNRFPTLSELEDRCSMSSLHLIKLLQKLVNDQWITIDENIDHISGFRSESYNLSMLYDRLFDSLKKDFLIQKEAVTNSSQDEASTTSSTTSVDAVQNDFMYFSYQEETKQNASMYTYFEQTFGRPLSPIEVETMQIWSEEDGYTDDLIMAALREAESVGKLYIRYIDRILLEWQRNQVTNVEQAKAYSQRFRRQYAVKESSR